MAAVVDRRPSAAADEFRKFLLRTTVRVAASLVNSSACSKAGTLFTLVPLRSVPRMDAIGEIILRLKISELEAHLALREIERVGLNWVIDDPKTDPDEKYRLELRRERVLVEWGEIMIELQELREIQKTALEIVPRGALN